MMWMNLEDIKQNKLDKERQILYDRTYGTYLYLLIILTSQGIF